MSELPVVPNGDNTENTTTSVPFSFSESDESTPLLGQPTSQKDVWDRIWWRVLHWCGFCIGGITFLIGTLLYYPAIYDDAHHNDAGVVTLGVATAWLYTIGSAGFLFVDVQEFFTFTDNAILRINILCSLIGSFFYLVGSAGFLPVFYNWTPLIGT